MVKRKQQPPPEMEGTGGAEAAVEAETGIQPQRRCTKSLKTRAQMDKHNESCKRYRLKIKMRREEKEQEIPKLKDEHQKTKMELEEYKSKIGVMGNEIQQLKRKLEAQGQMLTSLEKVVEWFALQTNVQGGQVLATTGAVLRSVNELVSSGETGATYFQPSMAGFLQQTCFGLQHYGPAAAAGFANHNLRFGFDAPNSLGNKTGDWTDSATANYNLPEYGATNNHDNIFNNVVGAGLLPTGSSLEANPEASFMFDAANNHENDGDLLPHGHATGFQLCENPSSEAVWKSSP
ncbi:hypothetical protein ERO13_D03G087100v2 [Gossypium hirsutum]|uniref:Uncharacterized protein isoform X3 n=1 Tax=Gossypium hirsutum TaxID=3635 RepID=A0A1U8NT22_GOSHI|nr:uncharacterized protein LOC107950711 isoform X3 [Gossypium hirsutum]KAG4155015.1 hypothetical protein ERO13_D03G087100v2 [Gossypium hirsutum]